MLSTHSISPRCEAPLITPEATPGATGITAVEAMEITTAAAETMAGVAAA